MTEFKGTKGKWRFIDNFPDRSVYDECGCRLFSANRTSSVESQVDTEQKANSLLISKAPEMLKELQNTLNVIEIIRMITGNKDIGGHLGASEYRIKQLIKEATTL